MSFSERLSWVFLFVCPAGYAGYAATLVVRAGAGPLTVVAYGWPLVIAVLGTIAVTTLGGIAAGIATPDELDPDERDASIGRDAELVGYFALLAGVAASLALVLAEADHFWIGNALYLSMVLSAVISTIAKLLAYRRGRAAW